MDNCIKLIISNFNNYFLHITTLITLVFTITTFYMNKIKEQARVKIIFEPVDQSKGKTDYNIIMKNDSKYPLYNFKVVNYEEISTITTYKNIGFLSNPIPIFESGQIFKSYFANFNDLREKGVEKVKINLEYSLKEKGKVIKRKYEYNVITFTKFCSLIINEK